MGSAESFNGTGTNNFLTGFKGLFKRVMIGAKQNEQRSEEKVKQSEEEVVKETPKFNIEDESRKLKQSAFI